MVVAPAGSTVRVRRSPEAGYVFVVVPEVVLTAVGTPLAPHVAVVLPLSSVLS